MLRCRRRRSDDRRRPYRFPVTSTGIRERKSMMKTALLGLFAAVLTAGAPGQAAPQRVPFYIFIGQSNSGWLGTAGMTAEQKAAYGGVVPDTDIWNPANGGYKATWE